MKKIVPLGILLLSFLCGTQTCQAKSFEKYGCSKKQSENIKIVVADYLKTHSPIPVDQVLIHPKRCVDYYAMVKIIPRQANADQAIVYLQQVNQHWQVLSLGTYFDKSFLQKLPPALRKAE
jgi:hypothetical protein